MPRRQLPPEPPQNSEAPPPPLPSRPNFRPAPPRPIVPAMEEEGPEGYFEPEEWVKDDAPELPPRNFSPSPEDGETYEVPDLPPSGQGKSPLPPPPQEMDGELYDELEGIASGPTQLPPQEEDCEEIYDPCEVKDADDGDLYEDPNEKPNPVNEEEEGEIYDAPEESVLPAHRPPPMPPSTNTIPAPTPPRSTPGQNKILKKLSSEGAAGLGISQDMIGRSRAGLKKVITDKESEKSSGDSDDVVDAPGSVKDRITHFKAVETGQKPLLRPKPNFIPSTPTVKPTAAVSPLGRADLKNTPETKSQTNQQAPSVPPPLRNEQTTPPPYSEEIYDDALAFVPKDPLDDEKWYHADRDRKECESDITKKGQDGTYLVRNSTNKAGPQPYTLVVLYKGHVYNLRIRKRDDNKIALGNEKELEQELAFDSVPELISHHTTNEVILINQKEKTQYRALLKEPLLRVS